MVADTDESWGMQGSGQVAVEWSEEPELKFDHLSNTDLRIQTFRGYTAPLASPMSLIVLP
jgi:hypothetical protein